jgi:branched-subunit amino acid ABC-type transport system permease component
MITLSADKGSLVHGLLLMSFNLVESGFGRALRAIPGETAAATIGIETWIVKLALFVVAAGFASVAGSPYAYYMGSLSPDGFGFTFSIELVVMVIVGRAASSHAGHRARAHGGAEAAAGRRAVARPGARHRARALP